MTKMFLVYFNNPESLCYDYSEVYNDKLLSVLLPFMHYTSIITIIFSILLIYIIITKTPKQMKFFKTYLLPYVFNTMLLEIVMLLFKPFLMHPYFAIYSLEFTNQLSATSLLIFFIFMSYFAMALIDCIVGMSAERYFAIKDFQTKHSKTPFLIFSILSGSSLAYLVFATIAVCFKPVRDVFIMPPNEAEAFLTEHLKNSNATINPESILVFRPNIPVKDFAMAFTIFVLFVFSRYFFALIFLILNATKSSSASNIKMSERLRKNNKMLLRCTYAQFVGFCSLAGFPAFVIVLTYYFLSEPSVIIYFCFLFMNCFGLYDILVTVICIKPYRAFFVNNMNIRKHKCLQKINPEARYLNHRASVFFLSKVFDSNSGVATTTIQQ